MKIELLVIGKTDAEYLKSGIAEYEKRLTRYCPYEMCVIPDIKNSKSMSEAVQKEREGELILSHIQNSDFVVLLDEHGKSFSSVKFANYIEQKMVAGTKRLILVVGGPYGFSDAVYSRANDKISLSAMTFSHQMVRLIFVEQLYRAMTILKGEPYHHE